jgi:MFS family permease
VTRAAFRHTNRLARLLTTRVINASKADGASESGLTALIWNQVLSYGTDAMVTVALAGTVFFGASAHAQRGNVLLYLLITMAPFAVVAPFIGPALDRVPHGRRWVMAGTAVGRAVLALVMAAHPSELLVLYPCALGSLVLSKAYAVVRAAAAPRLVPPGLTLTEANARLTIFGLASTLVAGGFVGAVIKVTGSYTAGLVLTAIAFATCAFFAVRLPRQIDAVPVPRAPTHRGARTAARPPFLIRVRNWARRGFAPHVIIALQGESALRLLAGLLTIYLAFFVESTAHGFGAALQLGAVVGAAGLGNFSGTAIGTRFRTARPEIVIVISLAIVAAACIVTAILFSIWIAVLLMYASAVTNALSKIALDALIQRDVVERHRSSAFARSETFLQLAWVLGAAIGVVLPSNSVGDGTLSLWITAGLLVLLAAVVALRQRATTLHTPPSAAPATAPTMPPG